MFSSLLQQTKPCFVVIEFYLGYRIFSLKSPGAKLCPPFWSWGDSGWTWWKNSWEHEGWESVPGEPRSWVRQSCGLPGPVLVMVLFCCVLTMMAQIMKFYILRRLVWVLPGFRKNGMLKGWVGAEPMPGCWEVHPGGGHGVGTPWFWSAVQLGFMFWEFLCCYYNGLIPWIISCHWMF